MTQIVTSAQMRAIERAAMDAAEVSGLNLMEQAGYGVFDAILAKWPALAERAHNARVLCGPGNNGGDGFVIARLLQARGWQVEVMLLGDPQNLPRDARSNYERWCLVGEVIPLPSDPEKFEAWDIDLVVDALFGIGLTRPLEIDPAHHLPDWDMRQALGRPYVVAVDLPSGLCADSGRPIGPHVFWADLTVTFHALKCGHVLGLGPELCGRVAIKDLGLVDETQGAARLVSPDATPLRKMQGHKYSHGAALVVTGAMGRTGAARLAGRGALRIGAGLVTLAVPGRAMLECAGQITALMMQRCDDGRMLERLLDDQRLNALCLGPALGVTEREASLVDVALRAGRATVLDADALTLLAKHPALMSSLHEACVLTPHHGEFARLFPDLAEKLSEPAPEVGPAYSKIDATREAAERAGCCVLYKGIDTVIADASGTCAVHAAIHQRAAPWLATAGAGDVLAGFLTGLMARGIAPMEAAEFAAWLHVSSALQFGPGLIAEDLPDVLPNVLRALNA